MNNWIAANKETPPENETVWFANEDFTVVWLGCYAYLPNEGWFWAEMDGEIYVDKGKIVVESVMGDDYDVHWWHTVPKIPTK